MTDRAAKRLRRLSTEYEDSEDNVEWNNSRYVADIPSTARSFALPLRQGPCSEHKAFTFESWGASSQSAAGNSATGQCHDLSPLCATRVNPCAHPWRRSDLSDAILLSTYMHHTFSTSP